MNALVKSQARESLEPTNLQEAMEFAVMLSKSNMVPTTFKGKPEDIIVAMQWGREIGLSPLQALNNIAVINGRPSIWGDSMLALIWGSGLCAHVHETFEGEGDNMKAVCRMRRIGQTEDVEGEFSVADAKAAGLLGKSGPWTQYRKRMLKLRARGFCARDAFPDVLRGVISTEEARDIPLAGEYTGTTIDMDANPRGRPDNVLALKATLAGRTEGAEAATEPTQEAAQTAAPVARANIPEDDREAPAAGDAKLNTQFDHTLARFGEMTSAEVEDAIQTDFYKRMIKALSDAGRVADIRALADARAKAMERSAPQDGGFPGDQE